jgi:hypothetical protein
VFIGDFITKVQSCLKREGIICDTVLYCQILFNKREESGFDHRLLVVCVGCYHIFNAIESDWMGDVCHCPERREDQEVASLWTEDEIVLGEFDLSTLRSVQIEQTDKITSCCVVIDYVCV